MPKHAFAVAFSGKVDRQKGIIHGVSVITDGEAQGHGCNVDAITRAQVENCCNQFAGGLKVVDRHTKSTDSVFSTTGTLKNFRQDGKQLRADLHILPSEPNREKLMDMAEQMPDAFGLSIAFSGPEEVVNGKTYARCTEIYNAALVDVPAANPTGLFAAIVVDATSEDTPTMTPDEIKQHVNAAVATALTELTTRFSALETSVKEPAPSKELSAVKQQVTELSANLDKAKTELEAKLTDEKAKIELAAKTVAQEFTRHTGLSRVAADGGGNGGGNGAGNDPKPEDKFIATVQKHFASTKSQTKALTLAIAEDKAGYAAFRSSGKNIKYS